MKNKWYTSKEIQNLLKLSDRSNFRKNYLDPARTLPRNMTKLQHTRLANIAYITELFTSVSVKPQANLTQKNGSSHT